MKMPGEWEQQLAGLRETLVRHLHGAIVTTGISASTKARPGGLSGRPSRSFGGRSGRSLAGRRNEVHTVLVMVT